MKSRLRTWNNGEIRISGPSRLQFSFILRQKIVSFLPSNLMVHLAMLDVAPGPPPGALFLVFLPLPFENPRVFVSYNKIDRRQSALAGELNMASCFGGSMAFEVVWGRCLVS